MLNLKRFIYFLVVCLVFLPNCARQSGLGTELEPQAAVDPLRLRAAEITSSIDDRLLAAQLLISGIDGRERLPQNMIDLFTEIPPGGIMLFRYNLNTNADTIRSFLRLTSRFINEKSGFPPFMAVDHEGGTVNRLPRGIAVLPAASSYWDLFQAEGRRAAILKIETDSLKAGRELNDLGINMNFAPVAEHLIDENRAFLVRRSYGPDPVFTAQAAAAFMRNMQQSGVLCVVKHFPGSAGPDPHYSASVLNTDRASLDTLASPFSYVINSGARAIMAAHTAVPVIDSKIASLSSLVMGGWLRGEMGFNGIIISDDFIMAAAGSQKPEDAAVLSIIAGSDMILVWPAHLRQTHQAILTALENESLSRERFLDAASRVIYEKLRMGLILPEETPGEVP